MTDNSVQNKPPNRAPTTKAGLKTPPTNPKPRQNAVRAILPSIKPPSSKAENAPSIVAKRIVNCPTPVISGNHKVTRPKPTPAINPRGGGEILSSRANFAVRSMVRIYKIETAAAHSPSRANKRNSLPCKISPGWIKNNGGRSNMTFATT